MYTAFVSLPATFYLTVSRIKCQVGSMINVCRNGKKGVSTRDLKGLEFYRTFLDWNQLKLAQSPQIFYQSSFDHIFRLLRNLRPFILLCAMWCGWKSENADRIFPGHWFWSPRVSCVASSHGDASWQTRLARPAITRNHHQLHEKTNLYVLS